MLRFPVRYVCMRRSGKGLVSSNVLKKALFRHFYLSADARFIQYFCALGSTDRVADFESVGCRFESYRACQRRNGLRSIPIFLCRKISHNAPSFLLYRKRARSARLFACERTHRWLSVATTFLRVSAIRRKGKCSDVSHLQKGYKTQKIYRLCKNFAEYDTKY